MTCLFDICSNCSHQAIINGVAVVMVKQGFITWVKENDSHCMVSNAVGKPAYKRDDDNDDTEGV